MIIGIGCQNDQNVKVPARKVDTSKAEKKSLEKPVAATESSKDLKSFLPEGYRIFEKIDGDINKDGLADCILMIKGTDKSKVINDEYRGVLDRNRRGIIALLNKGDGYILAFANHDCFSSENEDGGAYYAPELSVEIRKGNLYIDYAHGRYGYWSYTFRFRDNDFELIGYDESQNSGPVVDSEMSINFLTGRKITKVNTNKNADGGDEVFTKTVTKIDRGVVNRLSEILDFDDYEFAQK